jgi:hypothetical protein
VVTMGILPYQGKIPNIPQSVRCLKMWTIYHCSETEIIYWQNITHSINKPT